MESVHALLGIEANTFSRRTPPINPRHARNTRLRKKAYIERLKQSVSELSAHREKVQEKDVPRYMEFLDLAQCSLVVVAKVTAPGANRVALCVLESQARARGVLAP